MPLSSQLPLEASPRSAAAARRWVSGIVRDLARDDLVDSAELGTSELVTNAVLHGAEPIVVKVRGTAAHPRVEVHDGSPDLPEAPEPSPDPDDFLATFGRGLSIVARCATSWGATSAGEGKVVWFEPSDGEGEDFVEGVIDEAAPSVDEPVAEGSVPVHLGGFDVELMTGLSRQYSELRRELRLLALSHRESYPLATDLVAMFANYERQFPRDFESQLRTALEAGQRITDVDVRMAPEAAPIFTTMIDMFDLADAFCRAERLLSMARTDRQRSFHTWLLGEIVDQTSGAPPRAWVDTPQGAAGSNAHVS